MSIKTELVMILEKEDIDNEIVNGAEYKSLWNEYANMRKTLDTAIEAKSQRKKEKKRTEAHKEEKEDSKKENKSMVPSSSISDASGSPVASGSPTNIGDQDLFDPVRNVFNQYEWSNDKENIRNTMPTRGGGDCALHAILGEWSNEHKQFEYDDIQGAREKMRRVILTCEKNEKLNKLVMDCIRDWIMSSNLNNYLNRYKLQKNYQQFVIQQENLEEHHWEEFADQISQYGDVSQYILRNHTLSAETTFRNKFYNVLSASDNMLQGLIASIPTLQIAFIEYNQNMNINFDWQQISPPVRQEFAEFISTPRTWLAPAELNIIAHIFNKTIEYYPSAEASMEKFNSGKSDVVAVQFDNVNHFERINRISHVIFEPEIARDTQKQFTPK
jgi:hypothetical protein